MKAVIAIDSFKGSLSSMEAGNAVRDGILCADKNAEIAVCPVADGGEGTIDAVCDCLGGEIQHITVTDPVGNPIESRYGIIKNTNTAIIEMAQASGLTLIPKDKQNPLNTTTYGVGEMIKDAVKKGCRNFIVGIGGSATNDGGIGMLQALGFGILDKDGKQVDFGAKGLSQIYSITDENALPELESCNFRISCDVNNVLCGKNGCSAVFGPQKGATPKMVEDMDKWLLAYADVCRQKYPDKADPDKPGCGAAGGIGFAFLTFLNAKLEPGIEIVLDVTGIEDKIRDADIVITGEGKLDSQSIMGKTPIGIAKLSKKYYKPVIAFTGCASDDAKECNKYGIDAFFPILRTPCTLKEAMDKETAYNNLKACAEQVFRMYNAVRI